MKPTDFAKALTHYLAVYLPGQRNVSSNTIKSYRDTFKLFLLYCKQDCNLSIERLSLERIDKTLILGFLEWLEKDRINSVSTRNQRLACIHGFYRYPHLFFDAQAENASFCCCPNGFTPEFLVGLKGSGNVKTFGTGFCSEYAASLALVNCYQL